MRGDDGRRQAALARLALLVAVLAAVPLVSVLMRPDDVREPAISRPLIQPPVSSGVRSVDFSDERHGVALQRRCGSDGRCSDRILTTSDGSRWTEVSTPEPGAIQYARTVHALGHCLLLLHDTGLASGQVEHAWFSGNCGQSWAPVSARPRGTISEIPPGAVIGVECRGEACADYLVVTAPDTGERRWLTSAPWLLEPSAAPARQPDNGWWVTGRDPLNRQWVVAASHDEGHSWSSERLPLPPAADVAPVVRAGDAYVIATDYSGSMTILRSTDRGRSWQRTSRLDDAPPAVALWTRGGYLRTDGDGTWYRSPDGVDWTAIDIPAS